MKNYSKLVTQTSQTQPILGRTDMVQNNAGGYSFAISGQELLQRFLLIGSEGGTYYVGEQKLTKENAEKIIQLIKADGKAVLDAVVDVMVNNRAPKADPALFVLALVTAFGDQNAKNAAYNAISTVCRTATHLFTFLANIQNLRGWSRGLRKGVARWYTSKNADQLAYQIVKYRNRAGFTHKDAIKLAHPASKDEAINLLLKFGVDKVDASEVPFPLIQAFNAAQKATTAAEVVPLIEQGLTWEMVPTSLLNDKAVLTALLANMPLVALTRNLNRFSYNGLTESLNASTRRIVEKLSDEVAINKSGIHPINVVNSMLTYASGKGTKGDKTWTPNQNIVDALHNTFETAIKGLEATGKNILIGVDISGSMQTQVGGMQMSAGQVANILALTMLKSEKNAELVWFHTALVNPSIGRRSSILEVLNARLPGGGTDCSLPLLHAAATRNKYDAIIILTDNETWAGKAHAKEILDVYRKTVNNDVKVIEVALVSNPISSFPNDDKNLLRVVGFDASVIDVIGTYLRK